MRNRVTVAIALAVMLVSCSTPEQATPAHRHADWAGKWVGVEGMFVEITPDKPDTYTIRIQPDLDTLAMVTGRDGPNGIDYPWQGATKTLRAGKGSDAELRYLDGKSDCLIVETGVGFCRD